jgi:hypothetical protein
MLSETDRSMIEDVFKKYSLLDSGKTIPEPIYSFFGEFELVNNYFFDLGSGLIILAKVPRTEESAQKLWKTIYEFNRDSHPALLPINNNVQEDRIIIYRDGDWIKETLVDLNIIKNNDPIRKPFQILSGLAGFSRIYVYYIKNEESNQTLLVKFDRPDRMDREWDAIKKLKISGETLTEIQLPLHKNDKRHGILVTPAFHTKTYAGHILQFKDLLINQLTTNPENIEKALSFLNKFLKKLYSKASLADEPVNWITSNNRLNDLSIIQKILDKWEIKCNCNNDFWIEEKKLSSPIRFFNPTYQLDSQLSKQRERLLRGRTHGDLQTTNLLVSMSTDHVPEELAIIDIERMDSQAPIVDDLVSLEADFWRTVYPEIARKQFKVEDYLKPAIEAMVIAIDTLDGRKPRIMPANNDVIVLCNAAGRFICKLRQMSWNLLRDRGDSEYSPYAYMKSLQFFFLKQLTYPIVYEDMLKTHLSWIGASLAIETSSELQSGRYLNGRKFLDKWSDYDFEANVLASKGSAQEIQNDFSIESIMKTSDRFLYFIQDAMRADDLGECFRIFEEFVDYLSGTTKKNTEDLLNSSIQRHSRILQARNIGVESTDNYHRERTKILLTLSNFIRDN